MVAVDLLHDRWSRDFFAGDLADSIPELYLRQILLSHQSPTVLAKPVHDLERFRFDRFQSGFCRCNHARHVTYLFSFRKTVH